MNSSAMSSRRRSCTPTTPRCRFSTPVQGRTRTGRLWTYVRDDRPWGDETPPAVGFAYSPNRRGEYPQAHLKDFQGILQADAFAGYTPLYVSGKIKEAACWAHVRRKFYDLHKARASPAVGEALQRIRRTLRPRERNTRQTARPSAGRTTRPRRAVTGRLANVDAKHGNSRRNRPWLRRCTMPSCDGTPWYAM
jgi:hypothetical protein